MDGLAATGELSEVHPEARIIMAIDYDEDEDGYSEKSPWIAGSGSDLTSLR
jgi:hypothetical protein